MSDHFSGPAVMTEPTVDITDFYAFPSPQRSGHFVLVMNTFPLATGESMFSNAATYRFRIRALRRSDNAFVAGDDEHTIDITFDDVVDGSATQRGHVVVCDGQRTSFTVGQVHEAFGLRVFAGLSSDPFFMDVEAALRTDMSGRLSFDTAANTVHFRDVLSIVIDLPTAPMVRRFNGVTLVGAVAETVWQRDNTLVRFERVGRPEIKNLVLANPMRDPSTIGRELRDLYNQEDAFALSIPLRSQFESRVDANLAFFDELDGTIEWPRSSDGRHPLRDLLLADYLVVDLAHPFAPGEFLCIEQALTAAVPHTSAGGRWLDDDIFDELLTFYVNRGHGARLGDGVTGPTQPARLEFPYVREPNRRADLPLPAFLRG